MDIEAEVAKGKGKLPVADYSLAADVAVPADVSTGGTGAWLMSASPTILHARLEIEHVLQGLSCFLWCLHSR